MGSLAAVLLRVDERASGIGGRDMTNGGGGEGEDGGDGGGGAATVPNDANFSLTPLAD